MKACPICCHVGTDVYCPSCRRKHIIARMLTLAELRRNLNERRAGAMLVISAIDALVKAREGART